MNAPKRTRILLADDHTLFRDAIAQYLLAADPALEILVAHDVHGAVQLIEAHGGIDLVLLDLKMPGMEQLAGLKKIRERYPDLALALLSGAARNQDVTAAMDLGARGYFPKTLPGPALLAGIKRIVAGETYVAMDDNTNSIMPSHYPAGQGETGPGGEAQLAQFGLTPREREVLSFLARGASNKEIARELDLQIVTVKLHVRGVCRKLSAANRTQAALKAQELGIQ